MAKNSFSLEHLETMYLHVVESRWNILHCEDFMCFRLVCVQRRGSLTKLRPGRDRTPGPDGKSSATPSGQQQGGEASRQQLTVESVFPPDCVEQARPRPVKRRRLTARELGKLACSPGHLRLLLSLFLASGPMSLGVLAGYMHRNYVPFHWRPLVLSKFWRCWNALNSKKQKSIAKKEGRETVDVVKLKDNIALTDKLSVFPAEGFFASGDTSLSIWTQVECFGRFFYASLKKLGFQPW